MCMPRRVVFGSSPPVQSYEPEPHLHEPIFLGSHDGRGPGLEPLGYHVSTGPMTMREPANAIEFWRLAGSGATEASPMLLRVRFGVPDRRGTAAKER